MTASQLCPGSGKPPRANSAGYQRAGGTLIRTDGRCRQCGRRVKLLSNSYIYPHKALPEKEQPDA